MQSPTNTESTPSDERSAATKRRLAFRIRVVVFMLVLIGCGWYSRFFQTAWTNFFPEICAAGKTTLFAVDFEAFPARIGDQDNLCTSVGDGECERTDGNDIVRGECKSGRMHGFWSVTNTKAQTTTWSGNYCDGLPCGDFRTRLDANHEQAFRIDKLQVHGPATIWEHRDERFIEFTGRYEYGRRTGQWVHYVEPGRKIVSSFIFDPQGFITTTTFYCANGNRKEIRGKGTFLFDPQGKNIDLGHETSADAPELCPLP